jgi:hypothetical protein
MDLVYENYKEPLKRIPHDSGHGFYGTIATTKDKSKIQCHICGNLFASLNGHLRKHGTNHEAYRKEFQLSKTTVLCSDSVREDMQKRTVGKQGGKLPEHLIEYNKKVISGEIVHRKKDGKSHWSLERRNKEGLCSDQVLEKIKELAEQLGHTPSEEEFAKHYQYRFRSSIYYIFGTYLKAVEKAGMVSAKELKEPSNDRLIQALIDFKKEHGRIPMSSDFARGLLPPRAMYFRRFGTLNDARLEAGMNAVVSMGFGQIKELTPKEFIEYRNRHTVGAKK